MTDQVDPIIAETARVAELRKTAKQEPTAAEYIAVLEGKGYTFRLNELTQIVEVNHAPITDAMAATIRADMRDAGYKNMKAVEDAYLAHAQRNGFHPIRDYFNGLQWDGGRHIAHLAAHFTDSGPVFEDGSTWFHRALRRWLIGYVAKVFEHKQLPMLVLEGAQRAGKSFFVGWLGSILPEYCVEGPINPDDKDSLLRLASSFLWEVSELGATVRRSDVEALKSFVTLQHVTVRRPYGRFDLRLPATAGLIGTINDSGGFLNDSTGTRRALIVPVTSIDWQYSQSVDVIQVWAEAVAAYRAGEAATLTAGEREAQARVNESFEIPDPVADVIEARFDIDQSRADWFTPSSDILETVDTALRGTSDGHSKRIAAYLKRRGVEQGRAYVGGKRTRGYFGIARSASPQGGM